MMNVFRNAKSQIFSIINPKVRGTVKTGCHQESWKLSRINQILQPCFQCLFSQRLKQAQHLVYLSTCQRAALQYVWMDFKHRMSGRAREMLLSAACISVYNWEENKVSETDISDHMDDLNYIETLTRETITCKNCQQRIMFDRKLPDVEYCSCGKKSSQTSSCDDWVPFLERKDTLVWRKECGSDGLYAYKNVTALDFLWVQLDVTYRRQWDPSAVELLVIDQNKEVGGDVIHWEMKWPKPFANRDYVFQRQLEVDAEKRVCIIASTSTRHPQCPPKNAAFRVTDYWSFMVVRPLTDFNEPGLEFVLTYFDNPGVSLHSSLSSWVAMTGMPDFVCKLHKAAKSVRSTESQAPLLLQPLIDHLAAKSPAEDVTEDQVESQSTAESNAINVNVIKEPNQPPLPTATPIFA